MANSKVTSADDLTKDTLSTNNNDTLKVSFTASGRDKTRAHTGYQHKAFDFSDIGLEGNGKDSDAAKAGKASLNPYNLRKFHQTTIYVSNPSAAKMQGERAYTDAVITSNLPETFSYSLNSQWENPLNFGSGLFNLGAQIFAGDRVPSGVTRATSFRIWKGTEPMKVVIDIPVIDDNETNSKTNLVEALEVLSSLVLPRYSSKSWGFYDPPPSPLSLSYRFDENENYESIGNGQKARIMVQLGGILLLDHCVIEKVDVTYPNTKALIRHDYTKVNKDLNYGNTKKQFLHPLLANVKITVSTIEALTYDTYYKMIWGKNQSSGDLTLDLSWLKKIREGAYAFMSGQDLSKIIEDWRK